jgi:hypothetical protein
MRVHRAVVFAAVYVLFALAVGTVYIVAQHDGRSAAEDAPRVLLSAASTADQPSRLDLARYQGVFWIRYGTADQPVDGNGYLHGTLGAVPAGVLDTARHAGEDAVTWQPEAGLRFAIVAQPASGGDVIVAGQSLHRTELRASQSLVYVGLSLIAGAIVVALAVAVDAGVERAQRRTT